MVQYVVKRILLMIPTMIAISVIVFTIIQLPPGNYLESYIAELQAQGESVDPQKIAFLREYYGLDKPLPEQYLRWAGGMLRGDFGYSFEFNMPVTKVVDQSCKSGGDSPARQAARRSRRPVAAARTT